MGRKSGVEGEGRVKWSGEEWSKVGRKCGVV